MDGFHFYKAQLKQFEDPEEAFARRGAVWTFDAERFAATVLKIKQDGQGTVPSFDHGYGTMLRASHSNQTLLTDEIDTFWSLQRW